MADDTLSTKEAIEQLQRNPNYVALVERLAGLRDVGSGMAFIAGMLGWFAREAEPERWALAMAAGDLGVKAAPAAIIPRDGLSSAPRG